MRSALKRAIAGTPLEPVARRWWRRLRQVGRPVPRNLRDNQLALAILSRVLQKDSTAVDIGASYGEMLDAIVHRAPRGRHFAFEPIPHVAEKLRQQFPGVEVHALALSDADGEAEFNHVVDNSGYSGLRRRSYPQEEMRIETLRVRTARLDDVLPPQQPVDFVKVDVEGGELQVFRGAERTLRTHKPVMLFEHGLGAADFYGTTPEMVYDFLVGGCGLRISLLEGWLQGAEPLSRDQFVDQFHGQNCNYVAHP